ncbi:putative zinc-binding metallopeptidase [Mariniblastus sp.]|nr:putative zinc-binding metallopeptidase [Mariniblastus sp.]
MHPWEDYAETFATYLDVCSVVDNANHFMSANVPPDDFDALLKCHCRVGVMANEFNRDMGLLDLVPQVFVEPVVEKLRLIHDLKEV